MISKILLSMSIVLGTLTFVPTQLLAAASDLGAVPVTEVHPTAMHTQSPFSDYVASVAIYVLGVGFLVAVLLIGGFMILNLGLLSKRAEDRVGGRTPSDLGLLKTTLWPLEPVDKKVLPAEENGYQEGPDTGHSKPAA